MKIVVLDEVKGRNREISEFAEKKGHTVTSCIGANEFIETVQNNNVDFFIIDPISWNTGLSIYKYVDIISSMGDTPAVIYNAPENFVALAERDENEADIILSDKATADDIVEAI